MCHAILEFMYLAVDVGGTKTLVAVLDESANIVEQNKFSTPKDYDEFIAELDKSVASLTTNALSSCVVGVPGLLERDKGVVLALGNLPWQNKPIKADITKIIGGLPVIIENDARLAGLSEARLINETYKKVLFLTVSTGIGGALIDNGQIVTALQDTEMGKMPLLFDGQMQPWEEFAGGRSIVTRLGKRADDITNPEDWRKVADGIAYGLGVLCSILQPEAVVLGGPVGAHADKFSADLSSILNGRLHSVVRRPKAILAAQRPSEAVVYGCYDLARQVYGSASSA